MTEIKFGTDGWRAVMDKEFTNENVERLAQAFADFVIEGAEQRKAGKPRIVVGYDWRRNAENYADLFSRILIANGIETVLSDSAVPTPAISRAVLTGGFSYGIGVTASHNPGEYNGIKIKNSQGSSAEITITKAVEKLIDVSPIKKAPEGAADSCKTDLMSDYLFNVKRYIDMDVFSRRPCKVLVDSMHGVGKSYIADILKGSAVQVETIRSKRDTNFGGYAPEPIAKNFPEACELMKKGDYEVAFVTDGDGDRIGAARPGGEFVSPGKLLTLIMMHLMEDLGRKGDVVTTVSNTVLIEKAARGLGLNVHETPVGFKYVVDVMTKNNVLIAGEESGGIAFQDYMLERDGVLSALLLIQMMQVRGRTFEEILSDVERKYGKFLYARRDLTYPAALKPKIMELVSGLERDEIEGVKVLRKCTKDGFKFLLEGDAWLLFRMSGTEPLLRIYAESQVPGQAETLVTWGEKYAFSVT